MWWGICVVGIFCVVWNMFGIWVGNRIGVVCGVVGGGWCGVWCGVVGVCGGGICGVFGIICGRSVWCLGGVLSKG